jgi:CHAT domain-containing protein/tetratricopeptide (TPR) repeat protein
MSLPTFAVRSPSSRALRACRWLTLAGLTALLACRPPSPSPEWRAIRGGKVDSYPIEVAAGEFLGAVVEQDGIDLVVELLDRHGRKILDADSPDRDLWEEELAWMADRPGSVKLVVRPLKETAAPGRYRLRIDGPRAHRPEDGKRVAAAREVRIALDELGRRGREPLRIAHLQKALRLWSELGERRREAEVLYQIGVESGKLHQSEKASESFHRAFGLWDQLGLPEQRAWILYYMGRYERGPRTAVTYLKSALSLARTHGDRILEAKSLYQLGYCYDDLAEKQKALDLYKDALDLARKLGKDGEGVETNSLNSLGLLYDFLGHQDKAIELYDQALELSRKNQDTQKEAAALNNLALAWEKRDLAKARSLYRKALDLGRSRQDLELQAAAMDNLAFLEIRAGEPAKALDLCRRALLLTAGRPDLEAAVRHAMGIAYRQQGDLRASRRELETGLGLVRERNRVRESLIIPELARTERRAGNLSRARALLESGLDIVESLRTKVVEESLRAMFLASRQDIYSLYVDTLMAQHRAEPSGGHDAEALQASERARARSLLDVLAEAGIAEPLSAAGVQREVLDRHVLLLEYALGPERSFLWAVTPDTLHCFELPPRARIEEAARRYYGALILRPDTPEGKAAQAEVRRAADDLAGMLLRPVADLLDGQTLLVVSDGALQYIPFGALPFPSSLDGPERVPLIFRHDVVSLPSASVLAVLRRELAGRAPAPKRLAVLADPVFQREDMRVAQARGAARAGRSTGVIAASSALQRGGLPGELRAGEVDPSDLQRLRFSRQEADAIAALVPEGQRFKALDFDASRAVAMGGELSFYRMIHFATHGLVDSRHPELSSLVLSRVDRRGQLQNGFLRLHDIYNLDLNADLVVLSACQTALGQEIRGEGLIGLTRGFMYAGAARVLASLWSVDDRATSKLMERFYRHMIQDRRSAAAALRQAQIEMARESGLQPPYYWAGFSLQGEWR